MKIATIIVRVLLGLVFFVFGLGMLLHVFPMPPPPKNAAGDFMSALYGSGYLYAIKCFEAAGGLLLLIGKKVPLGLTLLGPVIVNILFYDIFLDHTGLPMGIVLAALSLFLLYAYRKAFAGLLSQ
jgi:putative oxidoreductase